MKAVHLNKGSGIQSFFSTSKVNKNTILYICPFAVYYLRYAVRSVFIISRISAKERDKKYSVKSPQRYKM
jgi:hypothetical protein